MGALPLRSLSRLWGYLNSFEVCRLVFLCD